MLVFRVLVRTCTPLPRRWSSSSLRRHEAVRTACANSPQRAGTVHLAEKLLLDEHVGTLCQLLRSGEPAAGRIFLERNNIGDTGAKQLACLLEEGSAPGLHTIRLYMNEIGDEGAAALVRAALSGAVPKLKMLSLDTNNLSAEGKAALRRQCASAPDLSLYL